MDILNSLLNSISTFLVNIVVILFYHCFRDTNLLWNKKKVLLLALTAFCNFILLIFVPDGTISFLISLIDVYIILRDYKGRKVPSFLKLLFFTIAFQTFVETTAMVVLTFIYPQFLINTANTENIDQMIAAMTYLLSGTGQLIIYLIAIVFFGIAFLCLYPLYKNGVVMRSGRKETWIILAFAYISSFFCGFALWYYDDHVFLRYCLAVLIAILSLIFPFFLFSRPVSEYYRKRTALQESHIQAELSHFQQRQQMQEETSRFRHDIRNNLLCINDLLEKGNAEGASQYLKNLLSIVESLSPKYVTGDPMVDSILDLKVQTMEQNGIRFELDGVLAGGLPWKPVDICNVFANALDNAIEACQKVAPEKRQISMTIKSTPQFWFVTIQNSVAKAVDVAKLFQKNGGYTSKSNADAHGIGTYNMKYTVESYGDMLKAECTDETFTLEIMIDKSSS